MPTRLEIVGETWYIYALEARERYHDVTLPVTTYMACKRSERGPENYERAWQRYLLARQVVSMHPIYGGDTHFWARAVDDTPRRPHAWLSQQGPQLGASV